LLSVASKSPRKGAPYADENSLGAKTSNFPTSQLGLPKIQVEHQNQNGRLITPNHLRWFLTLATAGQSNPTTNGMGIQLWDHQGACAHACDTEIDGGVCSCMWYRDWWGACAHPYIWYGEIASFSLFFLYPHENNIFFYTIDLAFLFILAYSFQDKNYRPSNRGLEYCIYVPRERENSSIPRYKWRQAKHGVLLIFVPSWIIELKEKLRFGNLELYFKIWPDLVDLRFRV
jgi:hypothetical protein